VGLGRPSRRGKSAGDWSRLFDLASLLLRAVPLEWYLHFHTHEQTYSLIKHTLTNTLTLSHTLRSRGAYLCLLLHVSGVEE
jgi:hypothetical protein